MKQTFLNKNKFFIYPFALFAPFAAYAADFYLAGSNFRQVILYILSVIAILVPILFALAFIVFFWGLSKFILGANNAEAIKKGKNYMIWGVLFLFILISFRSIMGLVSSELELGGANKLPLLRTRQSTPNVSTSEDFYLPDGTPINQ